MLIFSNPGELDPRLITILGANVKPKSTSPIGYFGTGMKYAIAGVLRLGGSIRIYSGQKEYIFAKEQTEIRGAPFTVVTMNGQTLGFTTELGKNWEPWMLYRELWANALDEGGSVEERLDVWPTPRADLTLIVVNCPELSEANAKRSAFLIEGRTPFFSIRSVEVYRGQSPFVFYRGIRVCQAPKRLLYTYNILDKVMLTEDRTASWWGVYQYIEQAIAYSDQPDMIANAATASEAFAERSLEYSFVTPGALFKSIVSKLARNKISTVAPGALRLVRHHDKENFLPERATLTAVEAKILDKALAFARRIGYKLEGEIIVTESLGEATLGTVLGDKIYISKEAFRQGTKIVAGTLIEEEVHLRHDYADCTRAMQEHFLNKMVSLGEELMGEPL